MGRKTMEENLPEGIFVTINDGQERFVLNYALQQNGEKLIDTVEINNNTDLELKNAQVVVTFDPEYAFQYQGVIDLPAHTAVLLALPIVYKTGYMQSLTEKQIGNFTLQVIFEGRVVANCVQKVEILAYDEWAGSSYSPETLAAFVTPNHPSVSAVITEASKVLREWGKDPSFEGYQTHDRNRVRDLLAAIYVALRRFNIAYANPPASFEGIQRVRMPHKVLEERKGTCLDLTVLYTACLEAAGLHPLIILVYGHAFAGCWLIDCPEGQFSGGVLNNHATLVDLTAHQDHRILLVNTVNFCLDSKSDFAEANAEARAYLSEISDFQYALDIHALRDRIKPMAIRINNDIEDEQFIIPQTGKIVEAAPENMDMTKIEVKEPEDKKAYAKQRYWEKKLLDLSASNPLISLYRTKIVKVVDKKGKESKIIQRYGSVLPLVFRNLGLLEDKLADGVGFHLRNDWENCICYPPKEKEIFINVQNIIKNTTFDESNKKEVNAVRHMALHEALGQYVATSFAREQLFIKSGKEEANKKLKNIVRTAKRSLEENGANTLYLVLGELRWFLAELEDKEFKKEEDLHAYIQQYIEEEALYAPLILVPVDIVRNISDDSYVLRSRLEETQINITLLEFLKQYFGIEIEGLDPLPLDAHGVDMELIMHRIKAAIEDKPFWEIQNDISMGHFSFAKFVMWNDIHNHATEMAQNKVIDSLLHGYRTWKPKDSDISEENIEAVAGKFNMIMPTSADSSQMVSIAQALNGESFVLQGPPGTGKSQTITNLIANALYNGKKVLFVAEKKAALDVVKRRLDGMGLANFCLSMHSDDANKVSLLARLEQTLETMAGKGKDEHYQQIVSEVKQLRGKLNGIIDALHCQRKYGCSLYQAIAILKKNVASKNIIKFARQQIIASSKEDLNTWKELVREYKAAMLEMGGSFNTALADYKGTSYSMSLKDSFAQAIEEAQSAVTKLEPAWNTICSFVNLRAEQASYNEVKAYLDVFQSIAAPQYLIAGIADSKDSEKLIQDINLFIGQLANYKQDLVGCEQYFDLNVLNLDIQAAKTSWDFATRMGDFDGVHNRLHAQLQSYAKPGVIIKPEVMPYNYNYLYGIIVKRDALLKFGETLRTALGALYNGVDTDAALVQNSIQENLNFAKLYAGIDGDVQLSVAKLVEFAQRPELLTALKQVIASQRALENFAETYSVEIANKKALPAWPVQLSAMLTRLSDNVRGLRSQVAYNIIAQKLEQVGLQCVVEAFEAGRISFENVDTAFNGGLYYNLVMGTVAHDERLADFYGMKYNQIIERYKQVVDQYQQACSDELVAKLCQRVAGILNETKYAESIAILKKAIKGKGRNKPIRKLFSEIQDLLPNIAPCMLMNPISVAQYIDISFPKFDLVIFDEASQIPTSEAVGAIARGVDTIVVGDSKQMPPTNFFANNVTSAEDEDAEDMESLLVDCQTISMPITELKWHYRSQHESLIAFSNLKYYNGHLLTFPTPNDLVSEVRIVHPEGYYDRKSGCNKAEAEAIVAEIIRRYRDPKLRKDSIGVITFNIKQQTYIEDMLEKTIKLSGNEDLLEFNITKNVFIKNLENVQGDEADVILFSIGYAPDKDGKLTMNFGPLNREGGWRRLNVAVSRSRKSMIIYSVLKPEQIRNDVTAQGVRNLKEFLAYAENRRTLAAERNLASGEKVDYLVQEIATAIEDLGYKVQCNIGNSEFKMDIGVVNPYNDAVYLLGILLDSENCKEAATAKDRFVLQPSILGGLGWKLVRLWILDWLDDADKVKMALKMAIEAEVVKAKAEHDAEEAAKAAEKLRQMELEQVQAVVIADFEPEEDNEDEELSVVNGSGGMFEADVSEQADDANAGAAEVEQVAPVQSDVAEAEQNNVAREAAEEQEAASAEAEAEKKEQSTADVTEAGEEQQAVVPEAENESAASTPVVKKKFSRRGPKEYKLANIKPQGQPNDFYNDANKEKIVVAINKVLAKEAPIEINALRTRIIALWGFSKSSAKLDASFRAILAEVTTNITVDQDRSFVWPQEQDPELYNIYREAGERSLGDIAVQEVINAAYVSLKEKGSMEMQDLQRDVAKRFNCSKFTKVVEGYVSYAVDKALAEDVFKTLSNGKISISRK